MMNSVTGSIQPNNYDPAAYSSAQSTVKRGQANQGFGKLLSQLEGGAPKALTDTQVAVKKGNTLSGLTRQWLGNDANAMSSQRLHQLTQLVGNANGLTDPNRIFVGQVLDFSVLKTATARGAPAAEADPSPNLQATTTPFTPTPSGLKSIPFNRPPASPDVLRQVMAGTPLSNSAAPVAAQTPRTVIVGDSIAVGIGGSVLRSKGLSPQYSNGQKSLAQSGEGLSVEATVGLSSTQILQHVHKNTHLQNAEMAVISAGTNDMVSQLANSEEGLQKIGQNLRNIRTNLNAAKNVWVLPYDARARDLVKAVAHEFGDATVNLADFAKADRYHPRNYADIAKTLKLPEGAVTPQPVSTLSFLQSRE